MDPASFITGLKEAIKWVLAVGDYLQTAKTKADEAHSHAIVALNEACVATRAHLAELREQHRNPLTNRDLANLWLAAHHGLMQLNPDLAERCRFKADYWSDPVIWNDAKIDAAKIGLDELVAASAKLPRECFAS